MLRDQGPIIVTIDPEFQTIRRRAALSGLVDLLDQLPEDAHLSPQGIAAIIALSIAPNDNGDYTDDQ